MKNYLRIAALILALLMCFGMTACGGTGTPNETEDSTGSSALSGGETHTTTLPPETTEATEAAEPPATWATYPEDRVLTAQQAFVYDCSTGSFVYINGGETDKVYLASITKLFTAYVALQYLDAGDQVTVGSELDLVAYGSSVAELQKGDVLTVSQLVEAMLLPSGNDAAYTLATAAGRVMAGDDSLSASRAVSTFVAQMNTEARNQGMANTHFVNPDGIHSSDHYSSMADLAILGKLVLDIPAIVESAQIDRDMVTPVSGYSYAWKNTNALIDPASEYYCPVCIGLKTGQTPSAGSCLLSAFDLDGRYIIIGVFGCSDTNARFEDTLQLLQMCLE